VFRWGDAIHLEQHGKTLRLQGKIGLNQFDEKQIHLLDSLQ